MGEKYVIRWSPHCGNSAPLRRNKRERERERELFLALTLYEDLAGTCPPGRRLSPDPTMPAP